MKNVIELPEKKIYDIIEKLVRERIPMETGGTPTYFDRFLDERFKSIDQRFDRLEKDVSEIKSDVRGLRWWFVGTAIAMLGIVSALLIGYASLQNVWIQRYLEIVHSLPK
jgi:hypothetical protein